VLRSAIELKCQFNLETMGLRTSRSVAYVVAMWLLFVSHSKCTICGNLFCQLLLFSAIHDVA